MDLIQIVRDDMEKNGFSAPLNIEPDGKMKRFKRSPRDKKEDAWYVAFYHTFGSKEFIAGAYGDWHDPYNWNRFCTNISITADEKKKLFKKIDKQFENSQLEKWEETSKAAQNFWNNFGLDIAPLHPYMVNKKIHGSFGIKYFENGKIIAVPVRDLDDRMWGYQKIYEDGKKIFKSGTKKDGNFHIIGGPIFDQAIYFCEGFSTGASIHMALSAPVVVCFDAGNLVKVAKIFRKKYKDNSFIICGDNDLFNEENIGKLKAEEAAAASLGVAVFPKFENLSTKPTDFNDLHVLEGLQKVVDQVSSSEKKEIHYINALGFNGETYFYTSDCNKQINAITAHSDMDLLKIIPDINWWAFKFPKQKGKGVDWIAAKTFLVSKCHSEGLFDRQNIRGHGVWMDQGKVVLHLGNRLFYDGKDQHIHSIQSKYSYEYSQRLPSIHPKPLSAFELMKFTNLIQKFEYTHPQQAWYLGGWIALSGICGALAWRPHIWLTGEAGSGKSTIKDFIDQILEWSFKRVSASGSTTEAGLRQVLKASAIPVVFDEFEPEDKKSFERVQSVLDLIRQASFQQSGEIIKGSSVGNSNSYHCGFMALVASIRTSLINDADRSRFTIVELKKTGHTNEQWSKLSKEMAFVDKEFSQRLFSRSVSMIDVILYNAKICQKAFVEMGHSQRVGQQYGTLMAGWLSMVTDEKITVPEAISYCRNIDLKLESTIPKDSDAEQCLQHLLESPFGIDKKPLIKFLQSKNPFDDKAIDSWQMSLTKEGDLFVQIRGISLQAAFKDSKWQNSWAQILLRLQGAKGDQYKKILGKTRYGIVIPKSYFEIESDDQQSIWSVK